MSSSILIIGENTSIISHIIKKLLERFSQVSVIDFEQPVYICTSEPNSNIQFYQMNTLESQSLKDIFETADYLLFLPSRNFANSDSNILTRLIDGTQTFCEYALQSKIKKVILLSATEIYGNSMLPIIPKISRAKLIQEKILLKFWREKKLPVIILRSGFIYGYRENASLSKNKTYKDMFKLHILISLLRKNKLPIVHIEDVINSLFFIIELEQDNFGKIYNLNNDNKCLIENIWKDIEETIFGHTPYKRLHNFPIIHPYITKLLLHILQKKEMNSYEIHSSSIDMFIPVLIQDIWCDNADIKNIGYKFLHSA